MISTRMYFPLHETLNVYNKVFILDRRIFTKLDVLSPQQNVLGFADTKDTLLFLRMILSQKRERRVFEKSNNRYFSVVTGEALSRSQDQIFARTPPYFCEFIYIYFTLFNIMRKLSETCKITKLNLTPKHHNCYLTKLLLLYYPSTRIVRETISYYVLAFRI